MPLHLYYIDIHINIGLNTVSYHLTVLDSTPLQLYYIDIHINIGLDIHINIDLDTVSYHLTVLDSTPLHLYYIDIHINIGSCRDRMVVGFTTTYAISAYDH